MSHQADHCLIPIMNQLHPHNFESMTQPSVLILQQEYSPIFTYSYGVMVRNKNFGLSLKEFEDLVDRLKQGDTQLFKSIFVHHFSSCMEYLQKSYSGSRDDAYDATMHTMLEFRRRLVENKIHYGNLRFLFTKMASQYYQRHIAGKQTGSLDRLEIADQPDDTYDQEDLDQLSQAWKLLDEKCQTLLKMNYYGGMKLTDIAEQFSKSPAALRKQKERCKSKLIQLFQSFKA